MKTTYTIHNGLTMQIAVKDDLSEEQRIRLHIILHTNEAMLCHAFHTNKLPVRLENGMILFEHLPADNQELINASIQFVTSLLDYVKSCKHISAHSLPFDEKCSFICLMLRIGMIGSSYKSARSLLAENTAGSCSFCSNQKENHSSCHQTCL